jgi:NNP family nitrate/nitrite transporter-like MFS transporter
MLIGAMGVYNQIVVGALGPLITVEFEMSDTLLANMMLAPLVASIFLGLVSGSLGDRFGPARVTDVGLVITVGGTVLRIFAEDFVVGFISMLLIGLGAAAMGANMPKLLAAWFKPSQMGLAVGVVMIGMAGGTGIAQATGARLGTPKNAFIITCLITAVLVLGFIAVVRDRPKGVPAPPAQERESSGGILRDVLRNPQAWLIAIAMALFSGWQMIFAGMLPTMLNKGHGMELAQAGAITSGFAWGGLAGCIIMPALATRLGMKPVIMGGALLAAGSVAAAWFIAPSPIAAVFLALSGCGGAAISCLITTAPALLPSIGPAKAGTAGGLMGTLMPIGGYVLPSFIAVPIAGSNYTLLTVIGAVTVGLTFFVMLGIPEYGVRAKKKAPVQAPAA